MTNQEINIAIAEACGWQRLEGPLPVISDATRWKLGHRIVGRNFLPDYCNDLNAMHEAENYAFIHLCHPMDYAATLHKVAHDRHSFNAKSRQRAEAFLRTLGKWRD